MTVITSPTWVHLGLKAWRHLLSTTMDAFAGTTAVDAVFDGTTVVDVAEKSFERSTTMDTVFAYANVVDTAIKSF